LLLLLLLMYWETETPSRIREITFLGLTVWVK
jgi:hypothetical protein